MRPENVAIGFMFVALAVTGAFVGQLAYRMFTEKK
jgi:uncharacterized membrane protein YbaN (DUF454 family)